ncbi:MAG: hypothetical protein IJ583_11665, partial [Firmicutes bacterium]|nr:hypothetical protein [Bacillota bacterium]
KDKNELIFNSVLLIIVCICSFVLAIRHEPWGDEAQTWLMARELSFGELFEMAKYEGHPVLWVYMIKFFQNLGAGYFVQEVLSLIISNAGLAILHFKSGINKVLKCIIAFSPIMIFWYPVVARNYCLVVFFLFLTAYFYKDRYAKPIRYNVAIFFLFNSHVLMSVFCSCLLFLEIIDIALAIKNKSRDVKREIAGLVIGILGGISLIIQVGGSVSQSSTVVSTAKYDYYGLYDIIMDGLIRSTQCLVIFKSEMSYVIFTPVVLIISIFILFFIAKHKRQLFILVVSAGFIMLVLNFIYTNSEQKTAINILIVIFCLWVMNYDEKKEIKIKNVNSRTAITVLLALLLITTYPGGYTATIFKDLFGSFSHSKETAEFINENIDDDVVILSADDFICLPIELYTENKKFWNFYTDDYYTYIEWTPERSNRIFEFYEKVVQQYTSNINYGEEIKIYDIYQEYIDKHFDKGEKIAVIIPKRVYQYTQNDTSKAKRQIIYVSGNGDDAYYGETYIIAMMQAN